MSASELKPLSLEEITMVQDYEHWSDFDMNDNFDRLLHTAREYHRLREAIEKSLEALSRVPLNSDANLEEGESLLREALKEAECICGETNSRNCPVHQ